MPHDPVIDWQDTKLAQLQAQLNDLARSMQLAQQTNQVQALAMFKDQFRALAQSAAALRLQISGTERLDTFDKLADQIKAVGATVGAPVDALFRSTTTLLTLLPLLVVVVVAGAIYWVVKGGLQLRVSK